jgi:hypothetical protein
MNLDHDVHQVTEWNHRYKPGTEVRYGDEVKTTRTNAFLFAGQTAAVWLEGIKKAVRLDAVEPVKSRRRLPRDLSPVEVGPGEIQIHFTCPRCGVSASIGIDLATKTFHYCKSVSMGGAPDPMPHDSQRIACHCPDWFMQQVVQFAPVIVVGSLDDMPKSWKGKVTKMEQGAA